MLITGEYKVLITVLSGRRMASVLCNVSLWLEHAQEARALGDAISDPEEKQQILEIAAGFNRIAELAKEQATIKAQYQLSD